VTADPNYLVDTGVFILYFRGDRRAMDFFRETSAVIYYSRVTRKELLRPPISSREREEVLAFLQRYRLVNPDPQIAEGFSFLLEKYSYLKDHLADALIAATAWKKGLEVVTTNPRHFEPIGEIHVRRFPEDFGG
jgi:predicted nucleic acid-binding protein